MIVLPCCLLIKCRKSGGNNGNNGSFLLMTNYNKSTLSLNNLKLSIEKETQKKKWVRVQKLKKIKCSKNCVTIHSIHYTSCNYRKNYFYSFILLLMCSLQKYLSNKPKQVYTNLIYKKFLFFVINSTHGHFIYFLKNVKIYIFFKKKRRLHGT